MARRPSKRLVNLSRALARRAGLFVPVALGLGCTRPPAAPYVEAASEFARDTRCPTSGTVVLGIAAPERQEPQDGRVYVAEGCGRRTRYVCWREGGVITRQEGGVRFIDPERKTTYFAVCIEDVRKATPFAARRGLSEAFGASGSFGADGADGPDEEEAIAARASSR